MHLKVIGSSSSGNCYLLYNDTECLILEMGFRFEVVKQALNFNLKTVAGAIITHEHGDHSKGLRQALLSGIDCYASAGTIEALKFENHRLHAIKHNTRFKVGNFEILPFNVEHDCSEPLGFLIRHPECGLTCFITDSVFCPWVFPGLNNIIVEANYCEDIIKRRSDSGNLHAFVKDRTENSHMSITTCIDFLKANDLSKVTNILLIHLSDANSNAAEFKQKVIRATSKIVHIAERGLCIPFNTSPF